jgi:transcriptional regulator with XRE-family HTH domain
MFIPEKIKKLRKSLGLSQREFSDKIGISRSVLSQIEINKIKASVDLVASISSTFNITSDYFFQDDSLEQATDNSGVISCKNCERLMVVNSAQKEIIDGLRETVKIQQRLIHLLDEKLNKVSVHLYENPA